MPWQYKFTPVFAEKVKALPHSYQKQQVRDLLNVLAELEHPKDIGGEYMGNWAYCFCGKSLIQCDINEGQQEVIFTNIVL